MRWLLALPGLGLVVLSVPLLSAPEGGSTMQPPARPRPAVNPRPVPEPRPAAAPKPTTEPRPVVRKPRRRPVYRRRADRVASYVIRARLDGSKHRLRGTVRLTWRNPSGKPADHLLFHLYLNAFKNETTRWLSTALRHRLDRFVGKGGWGSVRVDRVKVGGVAATESRLVDDGTVLRVVPAQPVGGWARAVITLDFEAQLPRVRARTGYRGDFHMVAQWFPKIGVREPDGTWRCHPFHMTTEFYADFGTYRVTLDVPRGYGVAATGRRTAEKKLKGGRTQLTYRAQDVHDFAWTTAPRMQRLGRKVGRVRVEAVHFGDPLDKVRRHLDLTVKSLALLQRWLGPYPWDTLTVVLVPEDAQQAGGMEYPTLFTSGVHHPPLLERAGALGTTVHELVHQYFYGLLASNEYAEPWLDEGFTSYVTGLVLDAIYGADRSMGRVGPLQLGYFPYIRLGQMLMPDWDPARQPADRFAEPQSYFINVYGRSALALRTLERQIGWPRMQRLLRAYVDRYRFRHPRGEDFFRTADQFVGEPQLRQFFRDAINTSGALDYAVARVYAVKLRKPRGRFDTAFDRHRRGLLNTKGYENRVLLHRRGELRIPVEVELRFAGGGKKQLRWDGQARWHWLTVHHKHPVISAVIDPQRTLALETRLLNNGRRTKPDARPARRLVGRLLMGLQTVLQVVGF